MLSWFSKPHVLALVLGNFVLFMIASRTLWVFPPTLPDGALMRMSVPAFGIMSLGYTGTLDSLERWRGWAVGLSAMFLLAAVVMQLIEFGVLG